MRQAGTAGWEFSKDPFPAFRAETEDTHLRNKLCLPVLGVEPVDIYSVKELGNDKPVLYCGTDRRQAEATIRDYARWARAFPKLPEVVLARTGRYFLPAHRFELGWVQDQPVILAGSDTTSRCLLFARGPSTSAQEIQGRSTGRLLVACPTGGSWFDVIVLLERGQTLNFEHANISAHYYWAGDEILSDYKLDDNSVYNRSYCDVRVY